MLRRGGGHSRALRAFLGSLTFLGLTLPPCRDPSPFLFSQPQREPCFSELTLSSLCPPLVSGLQKYSSLNQNHRPRGPQTPTVNLFFVSGPVKGMNRKWAAPREPHPYHSRWFGGTPKLCWPEPGLQGDHAHIFTQLCCVTFS